MALKFVHAADLHLDSPFKGLSGAPELLERVRRSTFTALQRIVSLCLRERVDFLLLAGDLYDTKDRSVRARLALRQELLRLHEAGIRTFIVHGNHDPLSSDLAGFDLPDSVKVFGPECEEVEVRRGGQLLCRVQGVSYGQERVTDNLSAQFHRRGPEFTIGLLHCNVGAATGHANYSPCSLEDLAQPGLDYWALGHVHSRSEHPLESGGVAVYPGNPQGRHVNETGERGCVLVQVRDSTTTRQFVPVDAVRWHRLTLDISALETLEGLVAASEEAVRSSCGEGQEAHAVRLTLTGGSGLRAELVKPGAVTQLEDQLRETFASFEPPVLLESVRDDTRSALDVEAILAAGGLAATVARASRAAAESRAHQEALWQAEELRKLDAVLHRHGLPRTREGARGLVERAGRRALELLVEEG